MKSLHIFRVLNLNSGISCYRAIHTDGVMFARTRTRNVPRKINYEPGLRRTETVWPENSDPLEIQNEEDLENSAELMNFEKEFETVEVEKKRRERLGYIITAKKFFSAPPDPATLTCNERECIRYLHKTDPLNWNVKALSECFPATPDAIRKVLKRKFIFSEERKRKIDLKVQKNWQLLSEGKLNASPEVLEHMKKFINRREVLLEQIKNSDFYLPEVKEEIIWNNGEMSNILVHYEKAIKKLAHEKGSQKQEMIGEGSREPSREVKKQMHVRRVSREKLEELLLESVKEKYSSPDSRTEFLMKDEKEKYSSPDSRTEFLMKDEKEKYSSPDSRTELPMKDVKDKYSSPESGKELLMKDVKEKYNSRGTRTEFLMKDVKEKYSSPDSRRELLMKDEKEKYNSRGTRTEFLMKDVKEKYSSPDSRRELLMKDEKEKYSSPDSRRELLMKDEKEKHNSPDTRTEFDFPNEIKKLIYEANAKTDAEGSSSAMKKSEEKSVIDGSVNKKDLSDPERLRREAEYYEKQVKDIENTAFWNNGQKSQDRALTESQKVLIGGQNLYARGNIWSSEVYPERIKIPRDKRGSGLTFRVKDCYYDDDGEFLYRVPGMVK